MSIDDALAVKECQQHLFGQAGMDLGLYWTGQARERRDKLGSDFHMLLHLSSESSFGTRLADFFPGPKSSWGECYGWNN